MRRVTQFFLFLAIASLLSCHDDGVIEEEDITAVDCGNFELFRPQETAGNYYYIKGVRLFPLDRRTENGITEVFYCKTLRYQFGFCVNTEYKRLRYEELKDIPGILTDPIVGDTILGKIVNPIKYEHASMQFDRDIYYRGTLIPAYTNLLGRVPISVPTFYFPLTISPWVLEEIHMGSDDFYLPNGKYALLVRWETFDNKTISDTVDVNIQFR